MFQIMWLISNLFGELDIEMPDVSAKDSIQEVVAQVLRYLCDRISAKLEDLASDLHSEQDRRIRLEDEIKTLTREKQEIADKMYAAMQKNGNSFLMTRLLETPNQWEILLGLDMAGQIDEQLRKNHKIEAIKLLRTQLSCGLKEAKDAVDARQDTLRPIPY
jgi:ribosomal protein L7/L12